MPPVKIFWYDGMKEQPDIPGVPKGEILGDLPRTPGNSTTRMEPRESQIQGHVFSDQLLHIGARRGEPAPQSTATRAGGCERAARSPGKPPDFEGSNGSLFIGDKGHDHDRHLWRSETRFIPVEKMKGYHFPHEFLTRSPGHYRDWIRAAKGGSPACSNFNVSGPFTEWVTLGVLALRFEGKLEWDSEKMRITNNAEANKFIKPKFRKGWSLT